MWIRKSKIESLSVDVKKLLAGEDVDIRDHQEGALHILRNDIHTLSAYKREQVEVLMQERDILKDTLADISHQLKTPLTSMMIMADLLENAPP
ncbi:MAG: sensor histidine kinase, partial [Turicibacter sp.]|nr:sensor histidine kinase [Turicibacter sp.]